MISRQTLFVTVVAAALIGCQSPPVQEAQVTAPLPPMPEPKLEAGDSWTAMKNGALYESTALSVSADMKSFKDNSGCTWTRKHDMFAPAVKWNGCKPFNNGTQTVTPRGEAWPIEVGKSWSYSFKGSNVAGDSWDAARRCSVEGTTKIPTALGEQDTYKVVCSDPWNRRTWYLSPALEKVVLYDWIRTRANERFTYEVAAK